MRRVALRVGGHTRARRAHGRAAGRARTRTLRALRDPPHPHPHPHPHPTPRQVAFFETLRSAATSPAVSSWLGSASDTVSTAAPGVATDICAGNPTPAPTPYPYPLTLNPNP